MGCQFGMSVSPTMCSVCTFVMLPAGCFATCASQTRVKAFSFSTFGTNQKLPSCKSGFATICNNRFQVVLKNRQSKTCARKFFAEPAFFNVSHLNLASSESGVWDVNRESKNLMKLLQIFFATSPTVAKYLLKVWWRNSISKLFSFVNCTTRGGGHIWRRSSRW